jgi:hypothetical protein
MRATEYGIDETTSPEMKSYKRKIIGALNCVSQRKTVFGLTLRQVFLRGALPSSRLGASEKL